MDIKWRLDDDTEYMDRQNRNEKLVVVTEKTSRIVYASDIKEAPYVDVGGFRERIYKWAFLFR